MIYYINSEIKVYLLYLFKYIDILHITVLNLSAYNKLKIKKNLY